MLLTGPRSSGSRAVNSSGITTVPALRMTLGNTLPVVVAQARLWSRRQKEKGKEDRTGR